MRLRGLKLHPDRGRAAAFGGKDDASLTREMLMLGTARCFLQNELMYRLGHATPDLALRYQRATATRDAAIAHSLDQLINEAAAQASPRARRRRSATTDPAQLTLD
ncbi:MAG: hypothetical protein NVSMB55_10870 [Mycobacteriales bacterium]